MPVPALVLEGAVHLDGVQTAVAAGASLELEPTVGTVEGLFDLLEAIGVKCFPVDKAEDELTVGEVRLTNVPLP